MFKDWTVQKWIGKLAPLVAGLLTGVWAVIEKDMPAWAPVLAGGITAFAQWIVSMFPPKA